jgi:hypothetical protein
MNGFLLERFVSPNKFENKRIPTMNILKKRKVFPMLVTWMDFQDEKNANHERIPSRNKLKKWSDSHFEHFEK